MSDSLGSMHSWYYDDGYDAGYIATSFCRRCCRYCGRNFEGSDTDIAHYRGECVAKDDEAEEPK